MPSVVSGMKLEKLPFIAITTKGVGKKLFFNNSPKVASECVSDCWH